MQIVHSIFVGSPFDRREFNQWYVDHHGIEAIDITGKQLKSRNGHEYIITVIDYFTNCAESYPIRDQKATMVVGVLLENC